MADEIVELGDLKVARNGKRDIMRGVVTIMYGFGFMAALAALIFLDIPDANKTLLTAGVGTLGALAMRDNDFWVGSTKGSSDKNDLLTK